METSKEMSKEANTEIENKDTNDFSIIVHKEKESYIVLYEGSYKKLSDIMVKLKNMYGEVKLVRLSSKEEYISKKANIDIFNAYITSILEKNQK